MYKLRHLEYKPSHRFLAFANRITTWLPEVLLQKSAREPQPFHKIKALIVSLIISPSISLADPAYNKLDIHSLTLPDRTALLQTIQTRNWSDYFDALGISEPENLAECIYGEEFEIIKNNDNYINLTVADCIDYYGIESQSTFKELISEWSSKLSGYFTLRETDHFDYDVTWIFKDGNYERIMSEGLIKISPSFSCEGDLNETEKNICRSPLLSRLDSSLSSLYNHFLDQTPRSKALDVKNAQREWISHRNSCTSRNCILNAYQNRGKEIFDELFQKPKAFYVIVLSSKGQAYPVFYVMDSSPVSLSLSTVTDQESEVTTFIIPENCESFYRFSDWEKNPNLSSSAATRAMSRIHGACTPHFPVVHK